ncbi:MAG TPA: DUF5700 domain-containing putative Zn-dependent protease [Thermoanaerobaculia bacterium]|jgi:hypothetical protein
MKRRVALTLLLLSLSLGCPKQPGEPAIPAPSRFSLRMDYQGAKALLAVLEQRTVTDADIDKLFAIRGAQAMVDNTTKFIPSDTRDTFRAAVKEFVTTRKSTIGHFRLDESHEQAAEIRALITKLKEDAMLFADVAGPINRYMPPLPHFTATVYGVTGGASDGFVPDDEKQPAFYVALNRAEGDAEAIKLQMSHELYHSVQRMARAGVPGLSAKVFDPATAPAQARLLTAILDEGTATYVVAEPLLANHSFFRRSSSYMRAWRGAYKKNASPEVITANFAEFDRLLSGLRTGAMSWEQVSEIVFKGLGPGQYFVGYEMAKALDRRYGPARIASLLPQHPAAFFRAYIDLYRENPAAVPARFSKETEAYIAALVPERRLAPPHS